MLEAAFDHELQELQLQQEAELAAVEAGLRKCHLAETEHLKAEHRSEMEELRTQQQEQVIERHHGSFLGTIFMKLDQKILNIFCGCGLVRRRR